MKVSTRVHYGLRAMTELARSYREERLLSISEIARNEALPLSYLEQLVGELRRAGLVEGTRGVHGGYRLARAPEAITVGDIYRVLEGEVAPVDCTAEDYLPGTCGRERVRVPGPRCVCPVRPGGVGGGVAVAAPRGAGAIGHPRRARFDDARRPVH